MPIKPLLPQIFKSPFVSEKGSASIGPRTFVLGQNNTARYDAAKGTSIEPNPYGFKVNEIVTVMGNFVFPWLLPSASDQIKLNEQTKTTQGTPISFSEVTNRFKPSDNHLELQMNKYQVTFENRPNMQNAYEQWLQKISRIEELETKIDSQINDEHMVNEELLVELEQLIREVDAGMDRFRQRLDSQSQTVSVVQLGSVTMALERSAQSTTRHMTVIEERVHQLPPDKAKELLQRMMASVTLRIDRGRELSEKIRQAIASSSDEAAVQIRASLDRTDRYNKKSAQITVRLIEKYKIEVSPEALNRMKDIAFSGSTNINNEFKNMAVVDQSTNKPSIYESLEAIDVTGQALIKQLASMDRIAAYELRQTSQAIREDRRELDKSSEKIVDEKRYVKYLIDKQYLKKLDGAIACLKMMMTRATGDTGKNGLLNDINKLMIGMTGLKEAMQRESV